MASQGQGQVLEQMANNGQGGNFFQGNIQVSDRYPVKPSHAVTFIKHSPVLKGHLFLFLSQKMSYELNLF